MPIQAITCSVLIQTEPRLRSSCFTTRSKSRPRSGHRICCSEFHGSPNGPLVKAYLGRVRLEVLQGQGGTAAWVLVGTPGRETRNIVVNHKLRTSPILGSLFESAVHGLVSNERCLAFMDDRFTPDHIQVAEAQVILACAVWRTLQGYETHQGVATSLVFKQEFSDEQAEDWEDARVEVLEDLKAQRIVIGSENRWSCPCQPTKQPFSALQSFQQHLQANARCPCSSQRC